MAFDSVTFLIFFAAFFGIYWALSGNRTLQNALILAGSYTFYGWWDYRFLGLIILSTLIDYSIGLMLERSRSALTRRHLMLASVTFNLGVLGLFKYFDFFAASLADLMGSFELAVDPIVLRLVLPVGISFYTFQSMAYTIDVYRGDQKAERNLLAFFCFIAFFPQLVAGPIERASHLLGQFSRSRTLTRDEMQEAIWLTAYGFFLKVVVANSVAQIADLAFRANQTHGWLVIIGTFAFAIQIYTDFLAYCLIARGTARLLGFHVRWNFDLPYFSTSLQDFWRRWNISLSEWLRDYLYVPLGGNRRGRTRTYLNLLATMVLGGLWHGAAWNFIAWGVLHGSVLCIERLGRGTLQWRPPWVLGWATTMAVVMFGWFLFRCDSWEMVVGMGSALSNMTWKSEFANYLLTMSILVAPLFLHEGLQYRSGDPLVALRLDQWSLGLIVGLMLAMTVAAFGRFDAAFIYFQF